MRLPFGSSDSCQPTPLPTVELSPVRSAVWRGQYGVQVDVVRLATCAGDLTNSRVVVWRHCAGATNIDPLRGAGLQSQS